MTKDCLSNLTQEQRKVVLHGCSSDAISPAEALLVLAGAGTGKTMTLAAFAAHRINHGLDPRRILVLAFNRLAASEMEARIRKISGNAVGRRRIDLLQTGTFHAIGLQYIRQYTSDLDLEQNFTVQDRTASAELMENVLALQKLGKGKCFPDIDACLLIYSFRANTLRSLKAVLSSRYREYEPFIRQLTDAFRAYDQAKRVNNVLDFDDLLTFWHRLLQHKRIGPRIAKQFDYVLVDEYQDISPLQDRILRCLRPEGRGLVLVGDDDQCIYGFRGTTPAQILDHAERAKILKLTESYRSTQPVLDACNDVISQADRRAHKVLWSNDNSGPKPRVTVVRNETAQARHIVDRVEFAQAKGIPVGEQAVLARTAGETEQLEAELKRRGIPYRKFGGETFFDQPAVRAVLTILSWCENPRDAVSGMKAIQMVPNIGPATAASIVSSLKGRLSQKCLMAQRPRGVGKRSWTTLVDLLCRLNDQSWGRQIETIRRYCRDHQLENGLSFAAARKLAKRAAKYVTRGEFLEAVNLREADATLKLNRPDRLTISTIHSAKGQEWRVVYILNAVDGCIPSIRVAGPEAVEEERRVLFVGMTRAKRQLELIVPKRLRNVCHNSIGLARTPFIPKRILHSFELGPVGSRSKRIYCRAV